MKPIKNKNISLEVAQRTIKQLVYDAAIYLEKLEDAGLCRGNGHHAAQKVAAFAAKEVEDRWITSK